MELLDLFHKWVPLYLRLPVLFLIFFTTLTANGIFLGNSNEIANDLGVYAEPYSEAYNALYIGMGLGLIFHLRIKMRFTNKQLLVYGLTMQLLMNIVCATTSNPTVFVAACLIIGFAKISAMIEVYIIWMYIWSKKLDSSRVYPFVYFTALSGIYFMTWLTTWLAYNYNWRISYIAVFILILLCIFLALLTVENNPLKRKIPLYQVDFLGLFLLTASTALLNYATVNGKVEDWFASKWIIASFFGSFILFLLFLKRQFSLKRPLFDLSLFRIATFRRGLFYFFILGIFIPGTFQSVFSGAILKYDMVTNMVLNLYLIPGILAGCILCYIWYYHKLDPDILIFSGFLSFVVYHALMYHNFSVSFAMQDFVWPSAVKGFGTALIYISVGLLTTKNMKIDQVISAAGCMLIVRSFLGSGIISALYSYFFYTQRIRHLNYLAGVNDGNNVFVQAEGRNLYIRLQEQATLTAAKEVTGFIIIAGFIWLTFLLVRFVHKKSTDLLAA
ncbi:MAG TPA: MFS transporter [Mucilaginibacter sp.]|jgi:MFS family permease